ncbi:DUF2575 family protein [Escherichia coli]|uniref:Uncharacterized protein n=4 Tax=Enterobacteriaceae TaxID=543 RepID=C3TRH2_ECOLX|nr:DUF2575 family protein [Escherichia coli]EET3380214.1 DUF2575 domain-containing protein [Escherichia coli O111]EET3527802.1 DUF2575 domain-containing protein [Escherichia coli O157:NM]EFW4743527.1 DUF2575 domain-containing protein [Shigella sonnei]EFW8298816.1 DUF2575 domain-containing protein [Shigella flexneri]EHU85753.1 hypothetical protein ECDEC3E_0139 [Escherichia coli DEC3E]EHY1721706.1 DUF2575 family protein [Escherichia coli O8]EJY0122170.1 DUF2575 family protein [Escherichia coli
MCRHSLRSDGAGFYQLAGCEYSFSAIKIAAGSQFLPVICAMTMTMKSHFFLISVLNRRLTLTAVQGILGRFSLF